MCEQIEAPFMSIGVHSAIPVFLSLGLSKTQILSLLQETYEPDVMQLRAVQSWTDHFSFGQIDNAPSHLTAQRVDDLGINGRSHPSDHPDLALCDFNYSVA
jgi:hypothetical protein